MRHISESCPYLPGRESCSLYLDGRLIGMGYRALLDQGYRRAGSFLYRPDCASCTECRVLRVPVNSFRRTKSQRRVWNRGRKLFSVDLGEPRINRERLDMYCRYLKAIHGEMEAAPTESDFEFMFVSTCLGSATREVRLWDGETLAGVGIIDLFDDAMSTVYFYYDPAYARYSPGTFSALAELDIASALGLKFYYLGYYIAECASMNYKANFGPCEMRRVGEGNWEPIGGAHGPRTE